jgi:hypothetical protein
MSFGDLAYERVIEDQFRAESAVGAEARERQEEVLLAGLGFLCVDRGAAAVLRNEPCLKFLG